MPDQTRDDYRPSAALSDQPWHLPSTLSRSVEREALVGASSLVRPVGDTSLTAAPAQRQGTAGQDVWSDVTIAHDPGEVRGGDELDDALDLVAPSPRPAPAPAVTAQPARQRRTPGRPQRDPYGQVPTQESLQGIADGFHQMLSRTGDQPRPARTATRRKATGTTPRPAQQSDGGRLVGTLVALGVVVKILFEVLRATGH